MNFKLPCPACKKPVANGATKCPHCLTHYTAEQMAERKSGAKAGFIGLGVIVAGIVLTVYACSGEDQASPSTSEAAVSIPRPAGSVAASDSQIAAVDVFAETRHASIKVDLKQGWKDASIPAQAALVLEAAGAAISAGKSEIPASNATVNFWFTAPLDDGTRGKVMEFRIMTDDLRRADYAGSPPQALLEYARDIEVNYRARAGVSAFCDSNRAANPAFCAGAVKRNGSA